MKIKKRLPTSARMQCAYGAYGARLHLICFSCVLNQLWEVFIMFADSILLSTVCDTVHTGVQSCISGMY